MQVVYFVKYSKRIDVYVWVAVVLVAGEMLGIVKKKGKGESQGKGASLS